MKNLMNLFAPVANSLFRLVLVVSAAMSLIPVTGRAELICSASSASTVTLNWTAPGDNGGGTVVQYDIRFATLQITEQNWYSATPVESIPNPQVAGSLEAMVVSGLTPSTDYYFAMKTADESYNWSALSSVVCRRTLSVDNSTPPDIVTDLALVNSTPTEVTLSWTTPANSTGGNVAGYLLQYSHNPITAAELAKTVRADGTPQPKSPGEQEQMVVSGLDGSTGYYFVLRSRNANFVWSGLSNVAGVTTGAIMSGDTYAYPNPFRPSETPLVTFASVPNRSSLVILTVSGDLVRRWTDNSDDDITWDGTNQSGNAAASGVYLWFVEGTSMSGKLIVIR